MIKAIIIDDEQHCINTLRNDIAMFCEDVVIADACLSAKEGMLSIKRNKPDLLFLDVEMPWMNGFEMLEILNEIDFQIIFTTAYDQFAAKAFRVSAVDYLLKPIDPADLSSAVAKVSRALNEKKDNLKIKNLIHNARSPVAEQKIAIPNREGFDFLVIKDILYGRASGSYTELVLTENRKLLLSKALGEVEQLLPDSLFERIHHSILINVDHVRQFVKTSGTFIVMNNGDELNVSKSRKEHLLKRLGIK